MTCDDYDDAISVRNQSLQPVLVHMHSDFNDSLPSAYDIIQPGSSKVIAYMDIFSNDRIAYLSIYAVPEDDADTDSGSSSPAEPTRPGSNINSGIAPPKYHLLARTFYSRRYMENFGTEIIYNPQSTEY